MGEIISLKDNIAEHFGIESKLNVQLKEKENEILTLKEERINLEKIIDENHQNTITLENSIDNLNLISENKNRKIMELEVQIDTISQSSQQKIRQIETSMEDKIRDIL